MTVPFLPTPPRFPVPRCVRRAVALWVAATLLASAPAAEPPAPSTTAAAPLELREVLDSVATQYPPYLAALIERDIAEGKAQSASGAFDLNSFARLFGNPTGYYESSTVDTGVEQFLGLWGATVFGGYRLTGGDRLPDYYPQRTQRGGELRFGVKMPLLQDGAIDSRRAAVLRARLDQELANPVIFRQHLDFLRAGVVAYYAWIAAGQRLRASEEILRVAEDRQEAITRQIERGLSAPVIGQENRQLVVSRELAVIRARRRFEASALALSLLLRTPQGVAILAGRERLPSGPPHPAPLIPLPDPEGSILEEALRRRPEIRQMELARERLQVDLRLARNGLLPRLDAGAEVSQGLGEERYADRDELELKLGLEFRLPLQRRQARGQVQELQGRLDQLERQLLFARDRIRTEIRNAHEATIAAEEQAERAALNVQLAEGLQQVERDRFQLGAADLLALQIREQAAFQARIEELEAIELYFASQADFLTAMAFDLRQDPKAPSSSPHPTPLTPLTPERPSAPD